METLQNDTIAEIFVFSLSIRVWNDKDKKIKNLRNDIGV